MPPLVSSFGAVAEIESAITRLAGVISLLTVAIDRVSGGNGYSRVVTTDPVLTVTDSSADPLADAQERLGRSIGVEAAAAQFDYLRTKYAKRPAELAAKVKSLLEANGVEAA